MDNIESREYISEKEAKAFKKMLAANLKDYKKRGPSVSDKEWLTELFIREIPDITKEEAGKNAEEIVNAVNAYDYSLKAVNDAAQNGVSKEKWLASKLEEASVGLSVSQYGQKLAEINNSMYMTNMELSEALHRASDGHIKMSPNLDGNIAENMIAKTTEQSAVLQGKNIKVEVRDVFTKNSVDVRAINLDTGKYQNYQLKFGKDAKATIALIERGNYNNQRIVVPSEQLTEVKAHFAAKGSNKTIIDHIEAFGVNGKSFTKEEMKSLQISAQEEGVMPSIDYSHYETKELALSIGKNAGAYALQTAAITTGLNIAKKIFEGEKVEADELALSAVKTGSDTAVKIVTAGTLESAVQKGIITIIPKTTPAGIIANIACVGIENAKILYKIATGEMSFTKGIDNMGRTTVSMIGGLAAMGKGISIGAAVGGPIGVVAGLVTGAVGYFAGSKVGEMVYNTGKKVANVAKGLAKTAVSGLKKVGSAVASAGKKVFGFLFG